MHYFPAALQELADQFARLPGIGGKTAQRLAFHVLGLPLSDAQAFADAIMEAKRTVHTCPVCQNLTDRDICPICDDDMRDHSVICVVAEPKDVIAMERSREFPSAYWDSSIPWSPARLSSFRRFPDCIRQWEKRRP